MVTHVSSNSFGTNGRHSIGQSPDREPAPSEEVHFRCEECWMPLWKAGEIVPAGTYTRVDDQSYRAVMLEQEGPLPATFDGHVALYCTATCACRDHAQRAGERESSTDGGGVKAS